MPHAARCLASLALIATLACAGPPSAPPADDAGPDPVDASTPALDAAIAPALDAAIALDAGGPTPVPDAGGPPAALPIDAIDELSLVILIGDSAAAGYNATGRNGEGGHGFARLLVDNHPAYPDFMGRDLRARWPALEFARVAESGATSADALANLRGALAGELPRSVPGDVLVLINVGGNDFNDSVLTIIDRSRAAAASAALRANLAEMFRLLRERYEDEAAGRRVVFLVDDLYDPTDGTGRIPATYRDGFCESLQSPLLSDPIRRAALDNLAMLNAGTAEEVAARGGHLVPIHDAFMGHGMTASEGRWLDGDCAHPVNAGHDAIRRAMWEVLTGERP